MAERDDRLKVGELEEFERALAHAHDEPWWRKFIETVKERRASFVETLVSGSMDQRSEDRCRGQISELNFILSLDQYAEAHNGTRPEST